MQNTNTLKICRANFFKSYFACGFPTWLGNVNVIWYDESSELCSWDLNLRIQIPRDFSSFLPKLDDGGGWEIGWNRYLRVHKYILTIISRERERGKNIEIVGFAYLFYLALFISVLELPPLLLILLHAQKERNLISVTVDVCNPC